MSAAAKLPPRPPGAPCRALVFGDEVVAGPDWNTSPYVPKRHRNTDPGKGTVTYVGVCCGRGTCNGTLDCLIEASFPNIGFEHFVQWGYKSKYDIKLANVELTKVEEGAAKAAMETHGRKIGELFNNPEFSDVKIVCGGMTFHVNKCIITVQSDVFKVMLKEEHVEGAANRIDVDDVEPEALKGLLYFMYQGRLEPDTAAGMATELFTAADKYNVEGLKELTVEHILKQFVDDSIEPEEALRVLVVADMHSNTKIKGAATEYILANKKKIAKAGNWDEFKRNQKDLAFSLFEKAAGF